MNKSSVILVLMLFLGAWMQVHAGTFTSDFEEALYSLEPGKTISGLVMMDEQADLVSLRADLAHPANTRRMRHEIVVRTLQRLAAETQPQVLEFLEKKKNEGQIIDYTPLWIANMIIVDATPQVFEHLENRNDVGFIYPDYGIELIEPVDHENDVARAPSSNNVEDGISDIRAPEVWAMGITGEGTIVSNLDTGVDGNHAALGSRWRGHDPGVSWDEAWFDPVTGTTFPDEFSWYGHGTHTMGTITGRAGTDTIGVAPGAKWIAAGVIDRVSIERTMSDAILAFQWIADPDGNPVTVDDVPHVCSNSWGISPAWHGVPKCDDYFWSALDGCEAAGVAVVFAAGNEGGGSESLRTPSDRITTTTNAYSVGALNAGSSSIAGFSSRGPSGCDHSTKKPEVCARGVSVRSSVPGGYTTMDGTSMACPHVAGALALLYEAAPYADPHYLKEVLMSTAVDLGSAGEDNTYGHGRIDCLAAVQELNPNWKNIHLEVVTPPPAMVRLGQRINWQIEITSEEAEECIVDVWLSITSEDLPPDMNPYIKILATQVSVPPYHSDTYTISMVVPEKAPISNYTVDNNIGEFPDTIYGSDWFEIATFDF